MLLNQSIFKPILLGICLLLFVSCAREYRIVSNSFADSTQIPYGFPEGSSFYVATTDQFAEKFSVNPLLDKEVVGKVERVLENNGYFVEKNRSRADYLVAVSFSVSQSKELVNVSHYIPGSTSVTVGKGALGKYEETTTTSGTSIDVPELHTFFNKHITLRVFDPLLYEKSKKIEETQIWHGEASNCEENNDFRTTLDYLLVAAFRNFGKNTYKNVSTRLYSDDKEIKNLRGALS